MLDGLSLDQIRAFLGAVDEGSFSAAARKLGRAQSAVSDMVRALELQLGVDLFDRNGRYPQLTDAGRALLGHAREIASNVDTIRARAKEIASGIEAELSVVIDVLFPIRVIAEVAGEFRRRFPLVPLRLYVEVLGGAFLPLMDKRATVGIVGSLPMMPAGIVSEALGGIPFAAVASANHPLAQWTGVIPRSELSRHIQIVLTDRSDLSKGQEFGVMSPQTWRLADLFAKRAFLLNGLGWGGMPLHAVEDDLNAGRLVELDIGEFPGAGFRMPMSAAYLSENPPGPAGRWLIETLKDGSNRRAAAEQDEIALARIAGREA